MNENKYSAKLQPRKLIKCPHCGWEYLPSEVLYPDSVLGKIKYNSVIRDPLGHILYEDYDVDAEAEEHFTCEHCGTPFIIEVETKFTSKEEVEELNFKDQTVELW